MGITIDLTYQVSDNQIFKIDLTTTAGVQYYGYAQPGTQDTDSDWKIYILNLNGDGVPISKQFANGTSAYVNKWSLRADPSYVYS